MSVAAAGKML